MAKYANRQAFTQVFPSPRGGSVAFAPGQCETGSWWERFSQPGKLDKVPDDYNPTRDMKIFQGKRTPPISHKPCVVDPSVRQNLGCTSRCDSSCQISCETRCELACEQSKQLIQVTTDYEKVGQELFCRWCDWSTRSPGTMAKHLEAYHPQRSPQGPAGPVSPGLRSDSQIPLDPGIAARAAESGHRAVPAQGSPAPKPLSKSPNVPDLKVQMANEYWMISDGVFVCAKCKKLLSTKWSTTSHAAMVRHAKRYHEYKD